MNASAPAARFAKPDPRPMRWAFGASAVAAVSILTVGFVKPDFASTDDQAVVNDSVAEQAAGATKQSSRARVNRVTRYVYLERGERAPRGATVIDADQAPGRRQQPRGDQPDDPRAATNTRATNTRPTNTRPTNNQRQNNDRPAADPQPRPEQPPRTTTHQSGG
ncbi:MAG TPA: hypothetical protein VMZ33_06420 [Candidatus Limnocylindrales bacterium]|nr:hypothetical protein [Candidatus Limnocylindrales bacterium]